LRGKKWGKLFPPHYTPELLGGVEERRLAIDRGERRRAELAYMKRTK